ncbi:MAG TPA: ATP-binding protein [Gemmatimonadaceae bacterium]|nr:ATP-binding protein [Gemmatimonadaceae bacterium]
MTRGPRGPARYETQVTRLALLTGLPGVALSLFLLWSGDASPRLLWTVGLLLGGTWLVATVMLRERVIRPLQTLSNMLAALREGDYSIRARGAERDDALGLALLESNLLGETLRAQRLGAMEATTLLRTVMAEIDVAIFAFDDEARLRLANRAGERLLDQPVERMLGRTAAQVGLASFLEGESPRTIDATFNGAGGRWEVRRGGFRQDGRPHTLLVIADVSKTLREQELVAWQRIVRVLSHEINNSLAPIKSLSGSMRSLLDRQPRPPDVEDDLRRALDVIGARSEALVRFMSAYARLAKLPAPNRAAVDVGSWVRRVAALETRVPVSVIPGPSATIFADGDQLEQMLLNVIRNAAEASGSAGRVQVTWGRINGAISIRIVDEGPGLPESGNLFVPFFTTKREGSGIGLVLSRQIAEAHGGSFALEDRADTRGCVATITLPEPD